MPQPAINLPLTDRIALFSIVALASAGCAILVLLGAPPRMLAVNTAALLCALIAYPLLRSIVQRVPPAVLVGVAIGGLLATALWGVGLEGVRRWLRIGPLAIHVGFILLPLLVAAAPRLGKFAPLAVFAAGGALWLQPDAGAATGLAAALIAYAAAARTKLATSAAVTASAWAVLIWFKPDMLAPVQFVERVPEFALTQNPILGVLALLFLAALPLPFLLAARIAPEHRALFLAQAGFWAGSVLASFLGHFPTPVLGVGVAPILGYAASWAALPFIPRSEAQRETAHITTRD